MDDELNKTVGLFKGKKEYLVHILLAIIAWFGYYIRTLNLPLLRGKYLIDPDAHLSLRYARYIFEHGRLFDVDPLRSYPLGFRGLEEFSFLAHFVVYLYKFLHIFNPKLTLTEVHIFYPAVAFVIALPFFYLFVKRLFGFKVALISSLFLTLTPDYLFRTISGNSDKEALAMIFFYAAFYFFIVGWQSKRIRYSILFGVISGITTAILGAIWGGVAFVILTISGFILLEGLFDKLIKRDIYLFFSWMLSFYLLIYYMFPHRYNPYDFFSNNFLGWTLLTMFIFLLIRYLIFELNISNIKDKFNSIYSLPYSVYSIIITITILLIGAISIKGFSSFSISLTKLFKLLIARDIDRWSITVAEGRQPYLVDWMDSFGPNLYGVPIIFWSFLIGSIFFFYEFVKVLHKYKWRLTITYSIFLFALLFSRYKSDSIFNGDTFISQVTYVSSFILIFGLLLFLYFYLYYKDKESLVEFTKLDKKYMFMFIFFIITAIGARSAIRLIFVFTPVVVILTSYLIFKLYNLIKSKIKYNYLRYILYATIILIYLWSVYTLSLDSINQASQSGTSLQWPIAMEWVKQNTPKDAVFASWWDYGYYIQTLSERATVTDGGNVIGYWNYLMGRHFLTAQNETEALEWLKSHNVSYIVIHSEDITKYSAFSSIGSDENYDRFSSIHTFINDIDSAKKLKNKTTFFFKGEAAFEEDYTYGDKLYPAFEAGIVEFFIPFKVYKENDTAIPEQPQALIINKFSEQQIVPINCLYYDKKLIKYSSGFDACIRIIPTTDGKLTDKVGAALYISPRVKRTSFADLYLFNGEKYPNFELVYSDEDKAFLASYLAQRTVGPLKIWKVNYPESTSFKEEYLRTEYPNEELRKAKLLPE